MPRNTTINAMAAIAAIALPAAAHAETVDFDCTATRVVDRKEYVSRDTFFAAARDIKPEYRRISISDANTLIYGVGGNDAKNWTLRISKVSPEESKELRVDTEGLTDKWGYTRWVHLADNGFITSVRYPDGTYSATGGYCKVAVDQDNTPPGEAPSTSGRVPRDPTPNLELRDPGQQKPQANGKTWNVPFEQKGAGLAIDGMLNDNVPIRWALDTGASITNIPYDIAVKLSAKVLREDKFTLADGRTVYSQVILIKKVSIGGKVYAVDIEASVSERGTIPLLGRNFLDAFSSYEINNTQGQLILRQ